MNDSSKSANTCTTLTPITNCALVASCRSKLYTNLVSKRAKQCLTIIKTLFYVWIALWWQVKSFQIYNVLLLLFVLRYLSSNKTLLKKHFCITLVGLKSKICRLLCNCFLHSDICKVTKQFCNFYVTLALVNVLIIFKLS